MLSVNATDGCDSSTRILVALLFRVDDSRVLQVSNFGMSSRPHLYDLFHETVVMTNESTSKLKMFLDSAVIIMLFFLE